MSTTFIKQSACSVLASILGLAIGLPSFYNINEAYADEPIPIEVSLPSAETQSDNNLSYTDGKWFYQQLPDDSKFIYQCMEKMLEQDMFMTGVESFDLTSAGLSQADILGHLYGTYDLLNAFANAKDAFYYDYPSVFYVDFSNLSLRITGSTDENGDVFYHAYIGTGRYDDYYTKGFTNSEQVSEAIAEYNDVLNGILVEAGKKESDYEKVSYVHDYLTTNMVYRMENNCSPDNVGFIRTSYGALTKKEGLCESYTRAFKDIMDHLNIPCVMAYGVFQWSDVSPEPHIWNTVLLDDEWYAVDVTMDDPRVRTTSSTDIYKSGYETTEYLLVGSSVMNRKHITIGDMTGTGFEFVYPTLSDKNYGTETIFNQGGLVVDTRQGLDKFEGTDSGVFSISYLGMGCKKAAEQGYYMLNRFYSVDKNGEWSYTDWFYIVPDFYSDAGMIDTDESLTMYMPHVKYVEFGVTEIPHKDYDPTDPDSIYESQLFTSDPMLLTAFSGMIENENGNYVKPPYIKSITPVVTSPIVIPETGISPKHITAVYDEHLKPSSDDATPTVLFEAVETDGAPHDLTIDKIDVKNLTYTNGTNEDGKEICTVEFDFTPSPMWADDYVNYHFTFANLVGVNSEKAPNRISYFVAHGTNCCFLRADGYKWHVFGKPKLLDNTDLSADNWKTSDGSSIEGDITNRLALVVSSPNRKQETEMNDALSEAGYDEDVLSYKTYNISLTICKAQVIETGDPVRLCLGFPEGYGPNDAGTTFKAYHFIHDEQGNVTGVEEIPCIITQYGLVILCDSFSPFTIAAVSADEKSDSEKTTDWVLYSSDGGTIQTDEKYSNNLVSLSKDETAKINIISEDGFQIDNINVDNKYIEITDPDKMEITLTASEESNIAKSVTVQFTSQKVLEAEEAAGEVAIPQQAAPIYATIEVKGADINEEDNSVTISSGDDIELIANIKEDTSSTLFQWYKDSTPITAAVDSTYKIENATTDDAGYYVLEITNFAGASSAVSYTVPVIVNVDDKTPDVPDDLCKHPEEALEVVNAIPAGCTEPGYTGDTICSQCNTIIKAGEEIPTIGSHDFVDGTCSRCGLEDPDASKDNNVSQTTIDALKQALDLSTEVQKDIIISKDGSDVETDKDWTTQEKLDALLEAIDKAQDIYNKAIEGSSEVSNAIVLGAASDLNKAIIEFNSSVSKGTKKDETQDPTDPKDPSDPTDPDEPKDPKPPVEKTTPTLTVSLPTTITTNNSVSYPLNYDGDGTITIVSTNTSVIEAQYNAAAKTIVLKANSNGTASIIIRATEGEKYLSVDKTFVVTVKLESANQNNNNNKNTSNNSNTANNNKNTTTNKNTNTTNNSNTTNRPSHNTNTSTNKNMAGNITRLPFTDVKASDWYYKAVKWAYNEKLLTGYDGTTLFGPNDNLTRAQAAVILWRHFAPNEANSYVSSRGINTTPFADNANRTYYTAAVNWAYKNGILTGYSGTNLIGPNDPMTRQQMCAVIYRCATQLSKASSLYSKVKYDSFPDKGDVADYAKESVAWCLSNGVINGWDNAYIAPNMTLDRAQMAQIMMNGITNNIIK